MLSMGLIVENAREINQLLQRTNARPKPFLKGRLHGLLAEV
jgi:hypothetical protein